MTFAERTTAEKTAVLQFIDLCTQGGMTIEDLLIDYGAKNSVDLRDILSSERFLPELVAAAEERETSARARRAERWAEAPDTLEVENKIKRALRGDSDKSGGAGLKR